MGFIVKRTIETILGNTHDEFYVRVENGILNKWTSTLGIVVGHWDTADSAQTFITQYLEDDSDGPSGMLPVSMSLVEPIETWVDPTSGSYGSYETGSFQIIDTAIDWKEYPLYYEYPVTSSEEVTITTYTTSIVSESVEYIDFDETGSEFVANRIEYYEAIVTGSADVVKSKRDFELITGSLYAYGYEKVKQTYREMFGNDNIIDLF
jgi:hypothetical protein